MPLRALGVVVGFLVERSLCGEDGEAYPRLSEERHAEIVIAHLVSLRECVFAVPRTILP